MVIFHSYVSLPEGRIQWDSLWFPGKSLPCQVLLVAELEFDDFGDDGDDEVLPSVRIVHRPEDTLPGAGVPWRFEHGTSSWRFAV